MASFLTLSLLLIGLLLLYNTASLLINIRKVRKIGLPYYVMPFADSAFTYIALLIPVFKNWGPFLPDGMKDRVYQSFISLRWRVRNRMHEKLGSTTIINVTPGAIWVHVADADAIVEIGNSRNRFPKQVKDYMVLRLFGDNVVTTEGHDWLKHRRNTQAQFNERNNKLVWQESISQVCGMLEHWTGESKLPAAGSKTTAKRTVTVSGALNHIKQLTLHVISSAGFGVYLSFIAGKVSKLLENKKTLSLDESFSTGRTPPPGYTRCFRGIRPIPIVERGTERELAEALQYFQMHSAFVVVLIAAFPAKWLDERAPEWLHRYKVAYDDVDNYLRALINNEKDKSRSVEVGSRRDSLLAMMVRDQNTMADNESTPSAAQKSNRFTTRELVGNVFIFSVAGHETTAASLLFTFAMMTLYPEKQRWLQRKIDEALEGESDDPAEWEYPVISRLDGPLAVMFETLRLFPPVPTIPKWAEFSQELTVDGRTYTIPGGAKINLNPSSVHYNKKYWGDDVDKFDPGRWDPTNQHSFLYGKNSGSTEESRTDIMPTLNKPVRGSWIPFSEGYRACLAKRFAQVEFCAVIAVIFRYYDVGLALKEGETEDEGKARLQRCVDRSANVNVLRLPEEFDITLAARR